jgi:hypothetical protein
MDRSKKVGVDVLGDDLACAPPAPQEFLPGESLSRDRVVRDCGGEKLVDRRYQVNSSVRRTFEAD